MYTRFSLCPQHPCTETVLAARAGAKVTIHSIPTLSLLADVTDTTFLEELSLDPHVVSIQEASC